MHPNTLWRTQNIPPSSHILSFYDHILIQEQNYEHVSNNTCLHTKCPPHNNDDDNDDVY